MGYILLKILLVSWIPLSPIVVYALERRNLFPLRKKYFLILWTIGFLCNLLAGYLIGKIIPTGKFEEIIEISRVLLKEFGVIGLYAKSFFAFGSILLIKFKWKENKYIDYLVIILFFACLFDFIRDYLCILKYVGELFPRS